MKKIGSLLLLFSTWLSLVGTAWASPYYGQLDLKQLKTSKTLVLLDLKAFQQTTDYTCGPASVVTVLHYFRQKGDEMEMAKEMKTNEEVGTEPQDMVVWLSKRGYEAKLGENGSLKLLQDQLKQGIPIIVLWMDWGGHYAVCVGYDTRGTETTADDVIVLADPYDRHDDQADGLAVFNAERFESLWFSLEEPNNRIWPHVYITVAPPKK